VWRGTNEIISQQPENEHYPNKYSTHSPNKMQRQHQRVCEKISQIPVNINIHMYTKFLACNLLEFFIISEHDKEK
jgi:hypothetical protein